MNIPEDLDDLVREMERIENDVALSLEQKIWRCAQVNKKLIAELNRRVAAARRNGGAAA